MDKDIKKLWVDALRSGKYEQGVGSLNNGDKFCCLGVLCDISKKFSWKKSNPGGTLFAYKEQLALPPSDVFDWADLEEMSYKIDVLVQLNDKARANFEEIANYIEENL